MPRHVSSCPCRRSRCHGDCMGLLMRGLMICRLITTCPFMREGVAGRPSSFPSPSQAVTKEIKSGVESTESSPATLSTSAGRSCICLCRMQGVVYRKVRRRSKIWWFETQWFLGEEIVIRSLMPRKGEIEVEHRKWKENFDARKRSAGRVWPLLGTSSVPHVRRRG